MLFNYFCVFKIFVEWYMVFISILLCLFFFGILIYKCFRLGCKFFRFFCFENLIFLWIYMLMFLFFMFLWLWYFIWYFGILIYLSSLGLFFSYVLFSVIILKGYLFIINWNLLKVEIIDCVLRCMIFSWVDFFFRVIRILFEIFLLFDIDDL